MCHVPDAAARFYQDVSDDEAAAYCALTTKQRLSAFQQPLTGAGWHAIPSTYVVCTEDRALPAEKQRWMSAQAGCTREIASSHSPFASRPQTSPA
ncbi:alpha/beta hydrolase [Kribbella sp. CA-253562]|uniref:alpha/beta hydrolase n=1 Tax=Kribbella sp. CA-253562 TaxID=3239942 RepID=UPI003D94A839